MTEKITALTKEQEKYLPVFRKKWLDIGTSCEPADFERAEEQIAFFYKKLNKPNPIFLRFSSPLMCELGVAALKTLFNNSQLWAQLDSQLRLHLWSQLRLQLWSELRLQIGSQLGSELRLRLGSELDSQLDSELGSQLRAGLWSQLRLQLGSELWSELDSEIGSELDSQLWSELRSQLDSELGLQLELQLEKRDFYNNCFWGQHSAAWKAFYLFCHEIGVEYGADQLELLNAWGAIAESCGWWAPFEGVCIISDRPRKVSVDDGNVPHCEDDMAVKFSDGWGVHSWHGTVVPGEWITKKEELTPEIALTWENVEQRRAACEIIGWHNVLEHESLNPRIIDQDMPHIGTLIEVDLPDAPKQWFLKYQCGTGRYFAESVNDKSFDTALKANAGGNGWRGQGNPEDFIPFIRS